MYGCARSEFLPYDEIKVDRNNKLEDIVNTSEDSDIGYFIEVDLKYPDSFKKQEIFHLPVKTRKTNHVDFSDYMKI